MHARQGIRYRWHMVPIVTDSDEQRQVGVSTVMMLTQLNGPINSLLLH
jgi:hypothetical protein